MYNTLALECNLTQRLSAAVQRGKTVCVSRTVASCGGLDDF